MPTRRYQSWKGLGLEFAVVVIGILAALAVDDWRQAREDRATELHLLSSLIRDLESDSADQARQVVNAERVVAAGQRLLRMVGHPMAAATTLAPEVLTPSDIRLTLQSLNIGTQFDVTDATYTEMIATGSFGVVANLDLRRAISDYYGLARIFSRAASRRVDARPGFLSALADVGLVPEFADRQPDTVERLRSNPAIATQALRIMAFWGYEMNQQGAEQRIQLMLAVRNELANLQ